MWANKYYPGVEDKLAYIVRFLPEIVQRYDPQTHTDGFGSKYSGRQKARMVPLGEPFYLSSEAFRQVIRDTARI